MKAKVYRIAALVWALFSGLVATGCSKDSTEPVATPTATEEPSEQLSLSFEAESQEVVADDEEARALGYELKSGDDFKLPLITFGVATADGATSIPVMAFFRNKRTHQMVHVRLIFNTVKGSKKLFRTFSAIPELNAHVNSSNWNDWYVKMFIGGYPEKIGGVPYPEHSRALETDPTVNQVRFVYNNLWDVTPETTQVTIGDYLQYNKWSEFPVRPLPMETDWTQVRFTTSTGGNSSYKVNQVVFKPIGSLLRMVFENKDVLPVRFSSVSLYEANTSRSASDAMLINHLLVKLDRNLSFAADGSVNQAESVTRQEVTDGYIHYHFSNTNGVRTIKEIPTGGKRLLYLWVYLNPARTNLTQEVIRPSLYIRHANTDHRPEDNTRYYRSAAQTIQRDKYREGKSYRIRMNWNPMGVNDVDFAYADWAAGDNADLSPVPPSANTVN